MKNTQSIRMLQSMLRVISGCTNEIPPVIPDGRYGKKTENSVRAFQKAAGLPVTGRTDEQTWRCISSVYDQCLTRVSEPKPIILRLNPVASIDQDQPNLHTHLVQAMLLALSKCYDNIPVVTVDGNYGHSTEQAVKALQKMYGLPETGNMDRNSWQSLAGLYRLAAGNGII